MEQVRDWIFEKGQLDWGKMSNLPKSLKEKLTERYDLVPMKIMRVQGSKDTT